MMKILKARSPTQIHFRLGRDERIFFFLKALNKQTKLFEQMSSRKNIKSDPFAANRSVCCNIRFHGPVVDWLAHSESSLRKSGCWSKSNSGLHSSLHDNVQYHGQVPLDGSHRKGQVYTMLAILLVLEEAPWSGLDSVRATVGATPHISRGLGRSAGTVVEAAVADMVVVDIVGTVVDVDVVDMVVVEGVVEDNVAEDVVEDMWLMMLMIWWLRLLIIWWWSSIGSGCDGSNLLIGWIMLLRSLLDK